MKTPRILISVLLALLLLLPLTGAASAVGRDAEAQGTITGVNCNPHLYPGWTDLVTVGCKDTWMASSPVLYTNCPGAVQTGAKPDVGALSASVYLTIPSNTPVGSKWDVWLSYVDAWGAPQVTEVLAGGLEIGSSPYSTWNLAEGSTSWGFSTQVFIQNPNNTPATAQVTYNTTAGLRTRPDFSLPPQSQTCLNPAGDLGEADFSTTVTCKEGMSIAVDRRMVWKGPGAPCPEGHNSIGARSASAVWHFPEGSSNWGFETWVLVQNPNAQEVLCDLQYMREGADAVTVHKSVPANSRRSFSMSEDIGVCDSSVKVTASAGVICEQSMYRYNRREGSCTTSTEGPDGPSWYLPEGCVGFGFTTFVCVQNVFSESRDVNISAQTPSGEVAVTSSTMPRYSRKTIRLNDYPQLTSLPDPSCSITVGGRNIYVARSMYWGAGTASGEACHTSVGYCCYDDTNPSARGHQSFYFPDGGSVNGQETWTLVMNPNDVSVPVHVAYMTASGQGDIGFDDTIPPRSRRSYNMGERLNNNSASVMVYGSARYERIYAERSIYWNGRGAGVDSIGGYIDQLPASSP